MKVLNATTHAPDKRNDVDEVEDHADDVYNSYGEIVQSLLACAKETIHDNNGFKEAMRWLAQFAIGHLFLAYAYARYGTLYIAISGTYHTDVCIYTSQGHLVASYDLF